MDTSRLEPHLKERYNKQRQEVKDKLSTLSFEEARGWLSNARVYSIISDVNNKILNCYKGGETQISTPHPDPIPHSDPPDPDSDSDPEINVDIDWDLF